MKFFTAATALAGVVSASRNAQSPLNSLTDSLKSMTAEAKEAWDEVSMLFPQDMKAAKFFSAPKPHVSLFILIV